MTASAALIIGDVGSTAGFHVGDEAMLEALVKAPDGPAWTVVSLDPAATSARLGVPAVPRLGFATGEDAAAERDARLAEVLAFDAAGGAPAGDPAVQVLAALDKVQGLVVAGGGNLSSSWPEHVYERVALIRLARRRGLPVVVSGQTLGPRLAERERELLAGALREAALVGVRERDSQLLALDLGVPASRLKLQLDDAFLLGEGDALEETVPEPFIAVTMCTLGLPAVEDELLAGLSAQLAAIARHTGAPVVLMPHQGALDGSSSHDVRVAEDLGHRLRILDASAVTTGILTPAQTAQLTRRAALVITSRYHPLVFALSGGVPAIGIYLDEYTRTKMCGALEFAGLEDWSLHVQLAAGGLLTDAALELWERRSEVSACLAGVQPSWREAAAAHLNEVVATIGDGAGPSGALPPAPPAPRPAGAWRTVVSAAAPLLLAAAEEHREIASHMQSLQHSYMALQDDFRTAERYALSLRAALDEVEAEASGAEPDEPEGEQRPQAADLHATGSRSPSPEVVLTDLRHEEAGGDAHASMLVLHGSEELGRIVLRRHGATLEQIDRSGTPFVAIAAVLATRQARNVRLDAPVDELARANAERACEQLGTWFGWRPARIAASETTDPGRRVGKVGMLLSRGLDSMATYARHRDRLDALVSMDWRDPPYATNGTKALWRGTQRAALEAGLPLVGVSTNARAILDPVIAWDFSHGCVLASLGQLVSPSVGELLVAGAFAPGREPPAGNHPDLDPLWSSSALRVVYDSGGGGRNEKAALIADVPFCLRYLKVCWERPGDGNCGRCCKCVLTMTNFYVNGKLDAVRDRFEAPLSPDAVRWVVRHGTPTTPMNARPILERLAPDDPLRAPWELMLERALVDDPATARIRAASSSDD